MPKGYENNVAAATRLLVAMAGFASAPSPEAGLKVYDTIRQVAARPPKSLSEIADELKMASLAVLNGANGAPTDADVLLVQMVKIGLLTPREIVIAGMDADGCAKAMLAKLTDENDPTGEMRRYEMSRLFTNIVKQTLTPLLESKDFAGELTPAYFAEVLLRTKRTDKKIDSVAEKIDNLEAQTRDTLDALALRFGELEPEALPAAKIRAFLFEKAVDYRALCMEIQALRDTMPRNNSSFLAIEEAISGLDLEEAERLLASTQQIADKNLRNSLEENAKVTEARARVALLRSDLMAAYTLLKSAADSFFAIDELEVARRRQRAFNTLWKHSLHFGAGSELALKMIRSAVSQFEAVAVPDALNYARRDLGLALQLHGDQTDGCEGADLLLESVQVLLRVQAHFAQFGTVHEWGTAMMVCGIGLAKLAARNGPKLGRRQIEKAIEAHEHAMNSIDPKKNPEDWATNVQGLGIAFAVQFDFTEDAVLAGQIADKSIEAYHAALKLRDKDHSPDHWAQTVHNLANILQQKGSRPTLVTDPSLTVAARDLYISALTIRTKETHPAFWATTKLNLAKCEQRIADHQTSKEKRLRLFDALKHIDDALEVIDPDQRSAEYQRALCIQVEVQKELVGLS